MEHQRSLRRTPEVGRPGFLSDVGFLRDVSGATAIEYVLIASFIALVIIGGVSLIGPKIAGVLTNVAGSIR